MSDIENGRRQLGISEHDIWVGYFAVGGNGSIADVRAWLGGDAVLPPRDRVMLVQALDDALAGLGPDHPGGAAGPGSLP